ncbi:MAG: glutamate-5-semialdehyde dehydrogenase [Alphaproteobacteria bacterium]|jgi:glutamate-5-semialdehyde dehydrogenase|nr:glutamate-5-semialdehyde dehydrogenase [Alphaproteobacteria bacterium]MDP6517668.1 glutamate-5-semialdehyde dehydrogenase [Alphaproteobacteria bacterium]
MSAAQAAEVGDTEAEMLELGRAARAAASVLAGASTESKNAALTAAAAAIHADSAVLLAANAQDIAAAEGRGFDDAFIDRLRLDEARIEAMAVGLEEVAQLPDPVGRELADWTRPNGLRIRRVAVPLGVIGIIYESRPNVTADAGGLCVKSGNAAILRGGSESFQSSRAIATCLVRGLEAAGLPAACVQLVPTRDRAAVGAMLAMSDFIDVVVPRGGKSLIERVSAESRVPVIKHLDGICHVYVDRAADPDKTDAIVFNAKMRRTGICCAAETLLIHKDRADEMLPGLITRLAASGCEIRGDEKVRALDRSVTPATDEDWDTEYSAPILSVRVVDDLDQAVAHIAGHGSQHTDSIVTEDDAAAARFLNEVDSAVVLHNASTQFADGGEFGMGAEIGISTGKLHARGPVGLEQLTSYKYVVHGQGQVRP